MSKVIDLGDKREERLLFDLLESLDSGSGGINADDRENDAELAEGRAYLELLGLLPYELPAAEPDPVLKERLLAAVRRGKTAAREEQGVAEAPLPERLAERSSRPSQPVSVSPSSRWWLPLAASLGALVLGVLGWQTGQIATQRETIARLSEELERVVETTALAQAASQSLSAMESRLALVTSSRVEVCSLLPAEGEPYLPAARGVLYVAADHQHWYLSVEGLEPDPEGRIFQVWFHASEGTVSGGTIDPREGTRVELASDTMPAGTSGVSVTLEPAAGAAQPSGPRVLYGDQVMRIL